VVSGGALGCVLLFAAIAGQRALELRHAARTTAALRARGAVEHGAAHYPLFIVLHAAWGLGMILECAARGWPGVHLGWLGVWALAQALRYWAIVSLGGRWSTRILVLPGEPAVTHGPYRWLRHPNYVAVAIEIAAAPLAVAAPWTAALASALNAALLLGVRIPAEDRAWAQSPRTPPAA
jgi:methyltransferase